MKTIESKPPYQFSKRVISPLVMSAFGKRARSKTNKTKTNSTDRSKNPSSQENKDIDPLSIKVPVNSPSVFDPSTIDWQILFKLMMSDEEPRSEKLLNNDQSNRIPEKNEPIKLPDQSKKAEEKAEKTKNPPKPKPPQPSIPGLERSDDEIKSILAPDHTIVSKKLEIEIIESEYYSRESEIRRKFQDKYHLYGYEKFTEQIIETLEQSEKYEKNFYKDLNRLILRIPLIKNETEKIRTFHAVQEILRHYPLKWPAPVAKAIGGVR